MAAIGGRINLLSISVKKKTILRLLLLPLMLSANTALAVEDAPTPLQSSGDITGWQLAKEDKTHDIKAWQKPEKNAENKTVRYFKLDYIVDADLETTGLAYMDIENWARWWWKVKEVRMLKMTSPYDFIFYLTHQAPVANPDRDAIISVHVEPYNKHKGYATMTMKALPDYLPAKPGQAQMQAEDMTAKFTPRDSTHTRVELEGYIDPSGNMPDWSVTFLQRQAPYSTALGFQRWAKSRQDYYRGPYKEKNAANSYPTLMSLNN